MDAFYRGELRLGLKYVPSGGSKSTGGTLVVDIKQAKELPAMNGVTADSAVKLHLLPNRKSSGKRKTGVIKNNLNPVWEEKFTYENVSIEELSRERVLEISVWNYEKSGNTFIGGLRIGPSPGSGAAGGKPKDWMDSIGDEVTHWEDMLTRPGEWVEQCHSLRTSLNPRKVDLKTSSASAPPAIASSSSSSLTAPTEHAQKEPSVHVATATPVILADEFKRLAPKTSAHVERKESESQERQSTKSATDEQVSEFGKTSLKGTNVEEKEVKGQVFQPSIVSPSGEPFKKIAPVAAPVVHKEENKSQISAEIPTREAERSEPAAPPAKPVFSSSVRSRPNKPPVQTATEPRDVKTAVQASLPASDSGTGERLESKKTPSPPPRLGVRVEDETPSIQVEPEREKTHPASQLQEGEKTPQTSKPQAHSTPVIDLSEASRYTEETLGTPESYQVRF